MRRFHWVALPRFPGGPAGLYLKPMLAPVGPEEPGGWLNTPSSFNEGDAPAHDDT